MIDHFGRNWLRMLKRLRFFVRFLTEFYSRLGLIHFMELEVSRGGLLVAYMSIVRTHMSVFFFSNLPFKPLEVSDKNKVIFLKKYFCVSKFYLVSTSVFYFGFFYEYMISIGF